MSGLRLVFAGSPAAAVPALRLLASSSHEIAAVVTREDSPLGRKRILSPTAVATEAAELGLHIIKTNRLDEEATEAITGLQPDLGVIVAYGGMVREPLLSAPRLGWINLHFSLLPRWRGAAPAQRAIMAGDEVTGASVFQLVPELDAGELYGHFTQRIASNDTAGDLLQSLADGGATLLVQVVDALADGTARPEPQLGDVTLAPKLSLEDGHIDFTADVGTVSNLIRGVTPEPGAFALFDGARVKVLESETAWGVAALNSGEIELVDGRVLVGTATSPLELITVHPAGKKAMPAADWWRGRPATAGTVAE